MDRHIESKRKIHDQSVEGFSFHNRRFNRNFVPTWELTEQEQELNFIRATRAAAAHKIARRLKRDFKDTIHPSYVQTVCSKHNKHWLTKGSARKGAGRPKSKQRTL
jgi:hypothetical protein